MRSADLHNIVLAEPQYALSEAQIACKMSHARAWQGFVANGDPLCAVFEDAVEVNPMLVHLMEDTTWVLRTPTS
jgi:GR25 family glycosyltransferase involved in LPS biosynthesis